MKKANNNNLMVCARCLMGIESHEGKQFTKKHYIDLEDDPGFCEWCELDGNEELFELI